MDRVEGRNQDPTKGGRGLSGYQGNKGGGEGEAAWKSRKGVGYGVNKRRARPRNTTIQDLLGDKRYTGEVLGF